MKKYMYRYLSLVVSFIISVGMISISEKSYAATLGSSGSALTQSVIDRATPHISLDGYVYKLNSHSASQVLTLPEMELVKDQINMTNSAISQAIRDASASKDIVVSAINKKVIFTDCVTSAGPCHAYYTSCCSLQGRRIKSRIWLVWFTCLYIKNGYQPPRRTRFRCERTNSFRNCSSRSCCSRFCCWSGAWRNSFRVYAP